MAKTFPNLSGIVFHGLWFGMSVKWTIKEGNWTKQLLKEQSFVVIHGKSDRFNLTCWICAKMDPTSIFFLKRFRSTFLEVGKKVFTNGAFQQY